MGIWPAVVKVKELFKDSDSHCYDRGCYFHDTGRSVPVVCPGVDSLQYTRSLWRVKFKGQNLTCELVRTLQWYPIFMVSTVYARGSRCSHTGGPCPINWNNNISRKIAESTVICPIRANESRCQPLRLYVSPYELSAPCVTASVKQILIMHMYALYNIYCLMYLPATTSAQWVSLAASRTSRLPREVHTTRT